MKSSKSRKKIVMIIIILFLLLLIIALNSHFNITGNSYEFFLFKRGFYLGKSLEYFGLGPVRKGLKNGQWKFYYREGGKISAKGTYDNNRKTGKWNYFDWNGNVIVSGNFKDDREDGCWFIGNYSGDGRTFREHYKNGKLISTEYYLNLFIGPEAVN